jgi:hypothetical protein
VPPEADRTETRIGRGAIAGITALMLVGLLMGSAVGGRAVASGRGQAPDATLVREIAGTLQRAARRVSSPDRDRPAAMAFRLARAARDAGAPREPVRTREGAYVPSRVRVAHLDLPPPALC